MQSKLSPSKPFILIFYGYPGSGKTTFARQLSEEIDMAHVQADRITAELLGGAAGSQEQERKVAEYMTHEFLRAGVSVLYDGATARVAQRRMIREIARLTKAVPITIWLQIDPETAFIRTQNRDRRRAEDRYAREYSVESFQAALERQQNPGREEDYIVVSGKHTFNTQRSAIMKKLSQSNLLALSQQNSKIVKPELTNIVPKNVLDNRGVVRRNISIRG